MSEKCSSKVESPEQVSKVEVLNRDNFRDLLYPNDVLNCDVRLEDIDHGGVFKYFRPSDTLLNFSDQMYGTENPEHKIYIVSKAQGRIVGIAGLEMSAGEKDSYWVKFVDVDPEFQGEGHGRNLIEGMFNYAKEHEVTLIGSARTDLGEKRMGHIFEELSQKTGVTYILAVDDRRQ